MRMSSTTYRRQLRRLLAAVLSQDPSEAELTSLAEQLRQGRLAYDLSDAIESLLRHARHSGLENEFIEVEELERIMKQQGMRKEELVSTIRSLSDGGPWVSGNGTIRSILSNFIETSSERQVLKLRDVILSFQQSDDYLKGVSKRDS